METHPEKDMLSISHLSVLGHRGRAYLSFIREKGMRWCLSFTACITQQSTNLKYKQLTSRWAANPGWCLIPPINATPYSRTSAYQNKIWKTMLYGVIYKAIQTKGRIQDNQILYVTNFTKTSVQRNFYHPAPLNKAGYSWV